MEEERNIDQMNKKDSVKVSVIIPVYNVENYLKQCLESVINQTLKDIEIICIDDASTDGSISVLNRYAVKDKRIQIVSNKKNRGLSAVRNDGVKISKGKYLFFLDSDDYIENNALEVLHDLADKKQTDMLGFRWYIEREEDYIPDGIEKIVLMSPTEDVVSGEELFIKRVGEGAFNVYACMYLYSRRFLIDNNLSFDEEIIYEDQLFFFQVLMEAERVYCIPDRLYHYRIRKDSITNNESNDNLLKRLNCLCRIIHVLRNSTITESDRELQYAKVGYIRRESRIAIDAFTKIDSIPNDFWRMNPVTDYIMAECGASLYKGFFRHKFTPEEINMLRKAEVVLLYGSGKVGEGAKELLDERGIYNYSVVVTNRNKYMDKSISEIADWVPQKDRVVVLIASIRYKRDMTVHAKKMGFNSIVLPEI